MSVSVFLITPPFTQLNTPYPATAYLKGFLNTRNITSFQSDLGIEVTLALFCRQGLEALFNRISTLSIPLSENAQRMIALRDDYVYTIDDVINFLQGHNPTLAHRICKRDFLPEASRFAQLEDLDWAFGSMGTQDKAKHLATMYLEDLSDLINECIDEHFGFSRYAEKLARAANSFDELYSELQKEYSFVDELLIRLLKEHMEKLQPRLVGISVPFPGNLYSSLRCGQWIRQHYPSVKVAMGGGFANTELRSLKDPRVFEFYDFITLDDGEAPLEQLVKFIEGSIPAEELKRTFLLRNDQIHYINNQSCTDYKQAQVGTPDYSDFLLTKYISAIEVVNPMHRMWSDGRWNKLTMAHGCYWGKCTFCDISLDYIKLYEPIAASLLVDRMEEMMKQTGQNGFHFVDEAAPPALMRTLALEIIRRKLTVSWWANIRFEKSFTRDLCILLKRSGCIAISGGLEVASDRLLGLINKGITVAQVAQVNKHFTEAGIMVHAYLMYGFPTQTEQETIDSLEMVRQMFAAGVLQSAFWHLFTMTVHSPVGMAPEKFNVKRVHSLAGTFANNDLEHIDEAGADHEAFAFGLKKSLFNYMHGIGLKEPLQKWFDFKVPKTSIPADYIQNTLDQDLYAGSRPTSRIVYLGKPPVVEHFTKTKKGNSWEMTSLSFQDKRSEISISVNREQGDWLARILDDISINNPKMMTLQEVMNSYYAAGLEDFELFWDNKPVSGLFKIGLLSL